MQTESVCSETSGEEKKVNGKIKRSDRCSALPELPSVVSRGNPLWERSPDEDVAESGTAGLTVPSPSAGLAAVPLPFALLGTQVLDTSVTMRWNLPIRMYPVFQMGKIDAICML